jgi:hypothetical protein
VATTSCRRDTKREADRPSGRTTSTPIEPAGMVSLTRAQLSTSSRAANAWRT